jgi:hypothetical protein
MIKIAGAIRRSFIFPAELPVAFAYYADLSRIFNYLPHILLVRAYGHDRFRMLYSTTELATYHIRIFCDLRATLDGNDQTLNISPLDDVAPVNGQAGLRSATTQGYYRSRSVFHENGRETRIDYSLQLRADLPTPLGLRFMPGSVVNRIAKNITSWRMREIADGFIQRSIDAFPYWLAEIEQPRCPSV